MGLTKRLQQFDKISFEIAHVPPFEVHEGRDFQLGTKRNHLIGLAQSTFLFNLSKSRAHFDSAL